MAHNLSEDTNKEEFFKEFLKQLKANADCAPGFSIKKKLYSSTGNYFHPGKHPLLCAKFFLFPY